MTQSTVVADALMAVAPVTVTLLEISTARRPVARRHRAAGRHRRLRDRAARAAARRRRRPRRPLAQGPADRAGARPRGRRRARTRGPARRAGRPRRLTLGELPAGSRIGTGSPRRTAQLRALGLGFEVVPIRGNVDTRLGKVASGELDAVVLARAGLARLGRLDEVTEVLDPLTMLPAPGQGALARRVPLPTTPSWWRWLALLDDPHTRAAVLAERSLLAELEAGCTAPVGAYAEVAEGDDGPRDLPARRCRQCRRQHRPPVVRDRSVRRRRGRRRSPGR